MPTNFECIGVILAAIATMPRRHAWSTLPGVERALCARRIGILQQPYLGPGVRERDFAKATLGVFIEHPRRDTGALKQLRHEMRLG